MKIVQAYVTTPVDQNNQKLYRKQFSCLWLQSFTLKIMHLSMNLMLSKNFAFLRASFSSLQFLKNSPKQEATEIFHQICPTHNQMSI